MTAFTCGEWKKKKNRKKYFHKTRDASRCSRLLVAGQTGSLQVRGHTQTTCARLCMCSLVLFFFCFSLQEPNAFCENLPCNIIQFGSGHRRDSTVHRRTVSSLVDVCHILRDIIQIIII